MNFEELKKEAQRRGIVPGAVVSGRIHKDIRVPEPAGWSTTSWGDIYCTTEAYPLGAWLLHEGKWATVITPAPSKGLTDGMVCEPDEHMRKAIVEKAVELGNTKNAHLYDGAKTLIWRPIDRIKLKQSEASSHGGPGHTLIPPGEFYDRLCAMAPNEKPIMIGGNEASRKRIDGLTP